MALSAQNDTGQSGAEDTNIAKQQGTVNELRKNSFIPNPEAKPFAPCHISSFHNKEEVPACSTNDNVMLCNYKEKHDSGIGIDSTMRMSSFEILNGINLGSSVSAPISMSHSSPNSEESGLKMMDLQLVTNGYDKECIYPKKHIAYHLLSNLLEDEISEDAKNIDMPSSKTEATDVFDGAGSWTASMSSLSSSFSLNLDLHDVSNQASFSNRSIHEIWSPNPSPKGSYPSTPSDESIPYFPSNHDNRDSPYHNRSPVDILAGRNVGSPKLVSPGSLPSDQSMLQHHSRRETSPFYSSKFSSIDAVNNNNTIISNGAVNGHSYDSGVTQKPNMRAIRALQFMDPGNEADQNGKDNELTEYMPMPYGSDDIPRNDHKGRKHQVHFEEKPRNGIIIKPNNGHFSVNRDDMMTAAKRLGSGLDECLDQLRNLEKECRKAEQELSRIYPSRRRSSSNAGSYHNRVPSNPTRVDKMIFEQLKVHDKVESLIGRIERLGRTPLHSNVGVALDRWLACVRELQNLRKDEINSSPGSHVGSYGCKSYDDRDLLALANCVRDLVAHTRAARTTVWCATQMLHAEEYWTVRPIESCGSLGRHSDLLSEKS